MLSGGLVDKSGTVATGNTAQAAVAADESRSFFLIHNVDASEDMWVNLTGTAAATTVGSILVAAKTTLLLTDRACPTGAVSVVAATSGHKYTCLVN